MEYDGATELRVDAQRQNCIIEGCGRERSAAIFDEHRSLEKS
jgi:hypothetical protein